ncbi:MAG: Ig-like domain-containing protein, partial [Crocinitomicaceae bacterium]|nr:Ig-like domain-containing protein [Crocinitomicaceae bacterium]
MDRHAYYPIIATIALLFTFFGCGEVGLITGGPIDNAAPKPIEDKVYPPMASKNIKPSKIIIPFDEFITLNKPAENIRVVPTDVRLEPKIKGKSLVLTPIRGEWKDSTTYAIYLKRAVKDITEGNDSIMIYVFATGDILDSLEAAVKVVDAFDNKPVKNVTVGLYEAPLIDDTSRVLPRYISVTDDSGIATFQYLKEGKFYVYAFDDLNKNNFMDSRERRGTLRAAISPDTAVTIIPELRLMPAGPPMQLKVRSNEVLPPATWCIGFNGQLDTLPEIDFISHDPIAYEWTERRDSLTIFYGKLGRSDRLRLAYTYKGKTDTIQKKFMFREALKYDYQTNLDKGVLLFRDTLTIQLNEAIAAIDDKNIILQGKNEKDTIFSDLPIVYDLVSPIAVQFHHDRKLDSIAVILPPGSINGHNFNQPDTIAFKYVMQQANKVGNLEIEFDTVPEYGYLELLNAQGKSMEKFIVDGDAVLHIPHLQPGEYKFRYVFDTNRDGMWTTGDIFKGLEAEMVRWFKDATKVRANWDVKVTLSFKEEEEAEEEVEEGGKLPARQGG